MPSTNASRTWDPQRKAVRDALKARNMSQAQFARDLGITPKHLSQMLTGATDGRLELWVQMAELLGMTWQLTPVDPNDSVILWARKQLGLEIEPWQAARMRQHLAGF